MFSCVCVCLFYNQKAKEIERLVMWYNPLNLADLQIPKIENVNKWNAMPVTEIHFREMARMIWEISPVIVVYLPDRYL